MEWNGTTWSFSSSLPSGQHTSSTSQWESLVTPSPCDRGRRPPEHPPDSELALVWTRGWEEPPPHPGSNSFPVEILLTHKPHVPYTDFMLLSWCFSMSLGVVICCCFCFLHTTKRKKKKYYFVRIVLPPRRYFEEFDKLPHFDNGSCVCTLFSEHFIISVKSYIYCYSIDNGGVWQWRAVECVRLFEMFVVGSWSVAVNLDGISLLTQFLLVSLYFL